MSKFNIEAYLNSLPEDIEYINVSGKGLTYLPDLSRFKKLKKLYCNRNEFVTLPLLPNSLKQLYCSDNELVTLPPLPNSLQKLICSVNQLSSLPLLPNSLQELWCYNNQLVYLPLLPVSLRELCCGKNQLVSLPLLPESLQLLNYFDNPIYNVISSNNINDVKANVKILNQFRDSFYCIKYKNKLRKLLWDIREKKVKEEFHPDRLKEMLEGKDIDDVDF